MSGFTEKEVAAELKRRADARDGRGSRNVQNGEIACAHCGSPVQAGDSDFPLCDACDSD
jgi:Zn finger protein HypA/HybF involved in hydrogenase expression